MYTSRLRATVESFRQELQLDAQDVCIGDTSALHLRGQRTIRKEIVVYLSPKGWDRVRLAFNPTSQHLVLGEHHYGRMLILQPFPTKKFRYTLMEHYALQTLESVVALQTNQT